jgi:hypothetical protein
MNPDSMTFAPPPTPDAQGDESEKGWILDQFYGGISDAEKQIVRTTYLLEKQYQFLFAQNGNILDYPNHFKINRSTVQDSPKSGVNMIKALPKWIVSGQPYSNNIYIYCADGKMFSRDPNGNYTFLFQAQDSQGNGLGQFLGYLYYTTNSSIGVYGPLSMPNVATNTDSYLVQGVNNSATTGLAPINTAFSAVLVGHGNNLGKFDGTNWTPNALTLANGTYIRSMDFVNQMLGISVSVNGVMSPNETLIYIWDGSNYTFNAFTPMDGSVDVILNWKNNLLSVIGSANTLYQGMSPVAANQRFPKLTQNDTMHILPGAVTKYKGQAMFGVQNTTSSIFQNGVYHWGNRNDNYPAGFNFDYTISTGNTTGVQIGALFGTGDQLFIGWADSNTGTYGVDVVQSTNPYYSSAFIEGVIVDDMRPVDDKNGLTLKVSHLPLNAGESIQCAFKVNRGTYVLSTQNTTVGSVLTKFPIIGDYAQFKELQCKFILGSGTGGLTTPTITSIGAAFMPQLTQSQY